MILCYRAVGSMRQNILRKDSEAAFKYLARTLLVSLTSSLHGQSHKGSSSRNELTVLNELTKCKTWKNKTWLNPLIIIFFFSSFHYDCEHLNDSN